MFMCYGIYMDFNFEPFASVFKALAEANRLRILHSVGHRDMTVSQIAETTGMSQPLVSHHLRTLRQAGLLKIRKEGPFVYHSLADVRTLEKLQGWREVVTAARQAALEQHEVFDLPDWILEDGSELDELEPV